MIVRIITTIVILLAINYSNLIAQRYHRAADPAVFDKLVSAYIPGAPKLGKPILIENELGPVAAYGMGWAAPLLYDVDGDGLEDLVIGEFGSGAGTIGMNIGNLLRVYRNIGSKEEPVYSNTSYFMPYSRKFVGLGAAPMSVNNWCCMAFTPRLVDLDGDGVKDLAAGVYHPGDVIWFKRQEDGFDLGKIIPQFGQHGKKNFSSSQKPADMTSDDDLYWYYSVADFADIDGDGKPDAIFGGSSLRYALNTGDGEKPALGVRTVLRDEQGEPLHVLDVNNFADKKKLEHKLSQGYLGSSMVPLVVDWDNDGVEDLLVTNQYVGPGYHLVTFFKGVRKNGKLSFLKGVPLFEPQGSDKLMPGSWPVLAVGDWNNDGVKDLLIGVSVTTKYDRYDHDLSWSWETHVNTGKMNPGFSLGKESSSMDRIAETIIRADSVMRADNLTNNDIANKRFIDPINEYRRNFVDFGMETVAHKGYVYVLLGEK
ncbi:FG-GAP repeat domain-containing protein [Sphingobacterium faecale]|uniref:VCBS repeat-containing protein n=1 Tax=Sphingobacterium faecale TaxID=2803775 RepID=A0ABS1R8H2_9SPHI|nr:VCBS repeat-containing protein [Sphingobacterium faecale]MBL1410997.1 VCBS repeat-containing protein [Sphingobacterium faecale]